ncbi:MAG: tetratricopeptide repeat protein [Proteobacteria bacterium]|jgi:hypothetical protein|nr:tetratricopeptide repeat protein [Pseudomonadota bacterium]
MTKRTSGPKIGVVSVLVLAALVLLVPEVLVLSARMQRPKVALDSPDQKLRFDLSAIESVCQMAEWSPITRDRAQHIRADLYGAAADELYFDGLSSRSKSHFEASWQYFERAAEMEPTADLIGHWLANASARGQHDKVLALSKKYPQWADTSALATAHLAQGDFVAAQPLLHQRCLESARFIECRSAALLDALLQEWEPALQAAEKMVELMSREEAGDETFQDVVAEAILEGQVLHARIAVEVGELEKAEQMFGQVVAANRANSQPQAAIGLAELLRGAGKIEESRKVLFAPVAKGGRGEEALVARRALTLLNEDNVEEAIAELERFYDASRPNLLESMKRFRPTTTMPESLSTADRQALLEALTKLMEQEDYSERVRRAYVSVLADACHLFVVDMEPRKVTECLYKLESVVEPESLLWFRYFVADRQNNFDEALVVASSTSNPMTHQQVVAFLNLGQFEGAADVLEKQGDSGLSAEAAHVIKTIASIDAENFAPPEVASDNVAVRQIVQAVTSWSQADSNATLMALGAQDLNYDLFRYSEWELIGAALFRQTDKAAFRFVLQGYANDMAQSYFYRQLDLMRLWGSMGELQHEAEQKQVQQTIAKHREARQKLNAIRWGLSR